MREIECSISGEKRVISDENTTVFYPSSQNGELPVKQSVVSFLYDTNMSDVYQRERHIYSQFVLWSPIFMNTVKKCDKTVIAQGQKSKDCMNEPKGTEYLGSNCIGN